MNALQGNPHSSILQPLSFEAPFYYLMNIPGLFISAFLIEKYFGSRILIGLYLANCIISSITTVLNHRRIGFAEVRKRGRMSNHTGNISLFFSSILVAWNPQLVLLATRSQFTTIYFYYLWAFYLVLYFTRQIASDPNLRARNYNETHIAGLLSGLLLGVILKNKLILK